jgi:hypothetical protein
MDDARIKQLAEEVLSQIRKPPSPETADLEARVAALEEAVRRLQGGAAPAAPVVAVAVAQSRPATHPSLRLLDVPGPTEDGRCCLEPDKPCVQSGQCRALGH